MVHVVKQSYGTGVPWWLSRLRIQLSLVVAQVSAVALIQPLVQELPHAVGAKKKKKNFKKYNIVSYRNDFYHQLCLPVVLPS